MCHLDVEPTVEAPVYRIDKVKYDIRQKDRFYTTGLNELGITACHLNVGDNRDADGTGTTL